MEEQLSEFTGLPEKVSIQDTNNSFQKSSGVIMPHEVHIGEFNDVSTERDFGLQSGMNQQVNRSNNQSGWDQFGNFLANSGSEVVGGAIEGLGYLADLQQHKNLIQGKEQEFGNWFSDLGIAIKDKTREEFPIYQAEHGTFNPGDTGWWFDNGVSIFSSLSLLIPASGVTKGMSMLGKALVPALNGLSKGAKLGAKGVTAAVNSRIMENTMESSGVFKNVYDKTGDKAKAGEAASKAWITNSANLLFDIPQYLSIFKGLGNLTKTGSKTTDALLGVAGNMVGEGFEEAFQFTIGKEAERFGIEGKEYFGEGFDERLRDYINDGELQTAAFFGALGGGVFSAGGGAINKYIQGRQANTPEQNINTILHKKFKEGGEKAVDEAVKEIEEMVKTAENITPEEVARVEMVKKQAEVYKNVATPVQKRTDISQEVKDELIQEYLAEYESSSNVAKIVYQISTLMPSTALGVIGAIVDLNNNNDFISNYQENKNIFIAIKAGSKLARKKTSKRIKDKIKARVTKAKEKLVELTKTAKEAGQKLVNKPSHIDGKLEELQTQQIKEEIIQEIAQENIAEIEKNPETANKKAEEIKVKEQEAAKVVTQTKEEKIEIQETKVKKDAQQTKIDEVENIEIQEVEDGHSTSNEVGSSEKGESTSNETTESGEVSETPNTEISTTEPDSTSSEPQKGGNAGYSKSTSNKINDLFNDINKLMMISDKQLDATKRRASKMVDVIKSLQKDLGREITYKDLFKAFETVVGTKLSRNNKIVLAGLYQAATGIPTEFNIVEEAAIVEENLEVYTQDDNTDIEQEINTLSEAIAKLNVENPNANTAYEYSRSSKGSNLMAYLARKYKQLINGFTVKRENIDNVLNESVSKEILDPNKIKEGTKIILKVKDDIDLPVYIPNGTEKEQTTWGALKTQLNSNDSFSEVKKFTSSKKRADKEGGEFKRISENEIDWDKTGDRYENIKHITVLEQRGLNSDGFPVGTVQFALESGEIFNEEVFFKLNNTPIINSEGVELTVEDLIPIVITDENGNELGYLHTTDWIKEENLYDDIATDIAAMRAIRKKIIGNGEVSTKVSKRTLGYLFKAEFGSVAEVHGKDAKIAVFKNGEMIGVQDENTPLDFEKKEGRAYSVVKHGNEFLHIPIKQNKLSSVQQESIFAAIEIYTGQLDNELTKKFKKAGYDLLTRDGIKAYLELFVYSFTPDSYNDLRDWVTANPISSTTFLLSVGNNNEIQFNVNSKNTLSLSEATPAKERKDFLEKLKMVLNEHYFNVSSQYLNQKVNIPTVNGGVFNNEIKADYTEHVRNNTQTNLIGHNIGTEQDPNWIYAVQSKITFDTGFVGENKKEVKEETIDPLSESKKIADNEVNAEIEDLPEVNIGDINLDDTMFLIAPTGDERTRQLTEIKEANKDISIPGVGIAQQYQMVTVVAEDIARNTITTSKLDVKNVDKLFNKYLTFFKNNAKKYETTSPRHSKHFQAYVDNWDTMKKMVENYLRKRSGINTLVEEVVANEDGSQERKSFADNATFSVDSKNTMSVRLKRFLSFVKLGEKTYLGVFDRYVPFDELFNTVSAILSSQRPSYEGMVKELERHAESKPWLKTLVENLNKADEQVRTDFVVTMSKHPINMLTMLWTIIKDKFKAIPFESNRNSISNVVKNEWYNDFKASSIVKDEEGDYSINKDKLDELKDALTNLSKNSNKPNFVKVISYFGIKLTDKTLDDIFSGNSTRFVRQGKKKLGINGMKSQPGGIIKEISRLMSRLRNENIMLSDNNIILNGDLGTAVTALAKHDAQYRKQQYDSSFKTGDKTVYSYGLPKYIINRFNKLKDGKLSALKQIGFSSTSTWLKYLDLDVFNDYFQYYTLDVGAALKEIGSKTNKSLGQLSPAEHELLKVSLFQAQTTISSKQGSTQGNETTYRIGKVFYPTMSDKATMMAFQTFFESVGVLQEGQTVTQEAVDLVYDTTVMSEVSRIRAWQNRNVKPNIKGYNQGAKLFLFFPELNAIKELYETTPNGKQLKGQFTNADIELIKSKVREYLTQSVKNKVAEWNAFGFTEDYKYLDSKYINSVKGKYSSKSNQIVTHAALDYVTNNLVSNTNIFQLFVGDPALFYKSRLKDFNSYVKDLKLTDEVIKENIDGLRNSYYENIARSTWDNIGKRLAGDLAPGSELKDTDNNKYKVGFLKDRESESLVKDFYKGLELNNYKNYLKIEGADAQEFTTWKEHLYVMYKSGKIAESDYNKASSLLSDGKKLPFDLLGKVMQPMKPVYVNNLLANGIDRRIYIKSSSFPLLPQITAGLELDKLRVAMEGQGIDRVAFGTAVKVGNVDRSLVLFNNDGTIVDDIEFNADNSLVLDREGFKIQQEVPYKATKEKVNVGTQERKLLFGNILDFTGFKYQGKEYTGEQLKQEYTELYNNLFKHFYDEFYKEIEFTGKSYNRQKLAKLLKEEAISRNYDINSVLSIQIKNNQFDVPLWSLPSADRMESLITSLVNNAIVKQKFPGKSYVLGTEEGFKVIEGDEGDKKISKFKNEIVWTDTWNGKHLMPHNVDPDGVFHPSQVLVPSNFQGVNIKELTVEKDGKLLLDSSKLPRELRYLFGFRIPTQGHNSMNMMEIVGFLPEEAGDLLIASRDFTQQMGSDFDVDKLFSYKYNYKYNEDTKSIERYDGGIKGLQNSILDIHFSVLSNPSDEMQRLIAEPLDSEDLKNIAKRIEAIRISKDKFNPLSDSYQREKYFNGRDGKTGVGTFSLDSTFNALIQKKNLHFAGSKDDPFRVQFGNDISHGDLSAVKTLDGKKTKTDVIAAYQNAAVDNANELLLGAVNANSNTFDAIRVLAQLGFNEKLIATFITQDIIKDYVNELVTTGSSLSEYSETATDDAYDSIRKQYKSEQFKGDHSSLADQSQTALFDYIEKGENSTDGQYYQAQLAILDKFINLSEYGKSIQGVQSAINSDSAGLGKSLVSNGNKLQQIFRLHSSLVKNASSLLGEYLFVSSDNPIVDKGDFKYIYTDNKLDKDGNMERMHLYIKPTTVSGFASAYGAATLNIFNELFPYDSKVVRKINEEAQTVLGQENISNNKKEKLHKQIFESFKSYLFSDSLTNEDANSVRKRLLFGKKSLAHKIKYIKTTSLGINNPFLNKLNVNLNTNGEPSTITFNAASSEDFDGELIYAGILDLLTNEKDISTAQDGSYTTTQLVEDLSLYTYYTGGIQQAVQFVKYIPVEYLKQSGFIQKLKDFNFDDEFQFGLGNNRNYYEVSPFMRQFVQHNPWLVTKVDAKSGDIKNRNSANINQLTTFNIRNKSNLLKQDGVIPKRPEFISIENGGKWQLYQFNGENYNRIDTLGAFGVNEYNYKTIYQKSGIRSNSTLHNFSFKDRHGTIADTVNRNLHTLSTEFKSVKEVLQSIIDNTETDMFRRIAQAFLPVADVQIRRNDGISAKGHWKISKNLIEINGNHLVNENSYEIERTILHEVTHALTHYTLRKTTGSLTAVQKRSVRRLKAFFETFKAKQPVEAFESFVNKVNGSEKGSITRAEITKFYAGTNIDEFAAEMMSNEYIQQFMATGIWKGDKTWWDRFVELVGDLLGSIGIKFGDNLAKEAFKDIMVIAKAQAGMEIEDVAIDEIITPGLGKQGNLFEDVNKETPVKKPSPGVEFIKNSGLSTSEANEFIDILTPIIEKSAERENVSNKSNYMFSIGKRWTRINAVRGHWKTKFDKLFRSNNAEFNVELNNADNQKGYNKLVAWKQLLNKWIGTAFDMTIRPHNKGFSASGFNYGYSNLDAFGNKLPEMKSIEKITKYIESKLKIDLSNYDSVLANVYTENQFIPPHRDTTEDERAGEYAIVVLNIGADGSISEIPSDYYTGGSKSNSRWKDMKLDNGGMYAFGVNGKNRFNFFHAINTKDFGKTTPTKPITLPDGSTLSNYRITLTYRRVTNPAIDKSPKRPVRLNPEPNTSTGGKGIKGEQIYNKLGNKTTSKNVIIKKLFQKEGIDYAKSIGGIFSLRLNNSKFHFGNPFSSKINSDKLIKTKTTKESVVKYIDWVLNSKDERASWIRDQINSGKLKNKKIIYYKELNEPSHATALDYLINNTSTVGKKEVTGVEPTGKDNTTTPVKPPTPTVEDKKYNKLATQEELNEYKKSMIVIGEKITSGDWLRTEIIDFDLSYNEHYETILGLKGVVYTPVINFKFKDKGKIYSGEYHEDSTYKGENSLKETYQKFYDKFHRVIYLEFGGVEINKKPTLPEKQQNNSKPHKFQIKLDNGMIIDTGLPFKVNDQQKSAIKKLFTWMNSGKSSFMLSGYAGCLGYGTKVLMFDGSFKEVQDVQIGDQLMGIDSTPRNVLELKQGVEQMYWVHQNKGMSYKVNKSHILSLKHRKDDKTESILNISVKEFIQKSDRFQRNSHGYKPIKPLNFNGNIKLESDPYLLGLWLADGRKNSLSISVNNKDIETIEYLGDCRLSNVQVNSKDYNLLDKDINVKFKKDLLQFNLKNNKHIPEEFIQLSIDDRFQLLAGYLSGDGWIIDGNTKSYGFCSSLRHLRDGLVKIIKSLGLSVSTKERNRFDKRTNKIYTSYFGLIGGDINNIPIKLKRKKIDVTRKTRFNITRISIEKDIVDDYYGFVLDGDHLFMLEDFTVTHNTGKSSSIKAFIDNVDKVTGKHTRIGVSAPTHKAKEVISKFTGKKAETIHKLLGLRPNVQLENFDINNPQFDPKGKPLIGDFDLIVLDEASMLNKDLFNLLTKMAKAEGTKLIFMGDSAQLPPVNEVESLVFSKSDETVQLTKVERTADSNPLMNIFTAIREDITSFTDRFKHVTQFNVEKKEGVVFTNSRSAFRKSVIAKFQSENYKDNPNYVKILAYTNATVNTWNNIIHESLFGNKELFYKGEIFMSNINIQDGRYGAMILENSKEYRIVNDPKSETLSKHGVEFKGYKIRYGDASGDWTANHEKIVLDHRDPNSVKAFIGLHDSLLIAAQNARGGGRGGAWAAYYSFRESIITAVPIKGTKMIAKSIDYAYAITTHKSQGSTYENVYVLENDLDTNRKPKERNQLKYVAFSRASKAVVSLSNKTEVVTEKNLPSHLTDTLQSISPQSINNNAGIVAPTPKYTQLTTLLEQQIRRLQDKLNKAKQKERASKTVAERKQNIALRTKIEKRLADKALEIELLKTDNKIETVVLILEGMLNEMRVMLQKGVIVEDIDYMKRMIKIIQRAGDFTDGEHIFLAPLQMSNEDLKKELNYKRFQADEIERQVDAFSETEVTKWVNDKLGTNFDKDAILEAIKDINSLRGNTLDISRYNDELANSIYNTLKEAGFKAQQEAKTIWSTVDSLIEKALPKLKQLDSRDPFSIFKQLSKGLQTGDLVHYYSQEYFDTVSIIRRKIEKLKELQSTGGKLSKTNKTKLTNLYKERNDMTITFDARKLVPRVGKYGYNPKVTQDQIDSHKTELVNHMGQSRFDKMYSRFKDRIERFEIEFELYRDGVDLDTTLHPDEKLSKIELWEKENSPYYGALIEIDGKVIKMGKHYVSNKGNAVYGYSSPKRFDSNGELTKWYDEKYLQIEKDEDMLNLYEYILETLDDLNRLIPEYKKKGWQKNSLPFIKKNIAELFLLNDNRVGLTKELWDRVVESTRESEISNLDYEERDVNGNPIKKVQIHTRDQRKQINDLVDLKVLMYKQQHGTPNNSKLLRLKKQFRLEAKNELAKEKSFDLGKVLKAWSMQVLSYKHKSAVEDIVNLTVDISKNRKELVTNSAGVTLIDQKTGKPVVKDGLTNLHSSIEYYRDVLYGARSKAVEGQSEEVVLNTKEKDEKAKLQAIIDDPKMSKADKDQARDKIKNLGGKLVASNVGDSILKYVQLKSLGWNILGGIANIGFGQIANLVRSSDNRSYTTKSYFTALGMVMKSVVKNSAFNPVQTNETRKIAGIMENYDILQSSKDELYKASNKSAISKKLDFLQPYVITQRAEYMNQAPVAVAVLLEKDMWKDFDENGNYTGKEDIFKVMNEIDGLIKKDHGNYRSDSPIKIKKHILGRALTQFRTWLYEGFATRFESTSIDRQLGYETKGRYRSYGGFKMGAFEALLYTTKQLARKLMFKDTQFNDVLSDVDAANMRANLTEIVILLSMYGFGLLLTKMDSDEDDWIINNMINTNNRLQRDIIFYINPIELTKVVKDPLPVFSLVKDVSHFIHAATKTIEGDSYYQSGPNKDRLRIGVKFNKLLPFGQQIERSLSSSKIVYDK